MNDSLNKQKSEEDLRAERQRMGFNDLMKNTFDKVNTPPQKEAEENVVQINGPTVGH